MTAFVNIVTGGAGLSREEETDYTPNSRLSHSSGLADATKEALINAPSLGDRVLYFAAL